MIPLLGSRPSREPRVGKVTTVSLADSMCMVLVSEGEVPAYLTDHVWSTVAVGAVVTLLPVGDTYEVISTRTGTSGSGGVTLGGEMIPNPSFEYGADMPDNWTVGYTAGDSSAIRDNTPGTALSGEARLLVSVAAGEVAPAAHVLSAVVRIDPDITYQAAAWLTASAIEPTLSAVLELITAPSRAECAPGVGAAMTHTIATVVAPGGAYQYVTSPLLTPTGHRYGRLNLRADSTDPAVSAVSVSWDVASLRQRITS